MRERERVGKNSVEKYYEWRNSNEVSKERNIEQEEGREKVGGRSRNKDLLTIILAPNLLAIDEGSIVGLLNWAKKTIVQHSYIHVKVGAALKETQSKIRSFQKTLSQRSRTMSPKDPQVPVDFHQAAEVKSSTL